MQLKFSAGKFELEAHTEGYPMWTNINYEGRFLARVHHSELPDLAHAVERIRNAIRGNLAPHEKHEVD